MTGPRLSIIPASACTDPALKPRDLQVLCVIGRHTNNLGWCRKSQVKMAAEMRCARSTVFDAIERLIEAGYLEKHVIAEDSGRDSPHVYRVVLDLAHPDPGIVEGDEEDEEASDAHAPVAENTADPADQSAPPADISAPPAGPGPAPKNDPLRTREKESARDARKDDRPATDVPGTAEFEKRVMRFCNGTGYLAGPWHNWDNTSPSWIASKMAALSVEDRAAAEQWRDAYLLDIRDRKTSPMPPGVFLRDRAWLAMNPMILDRVERLKQAKLAPEDRAAPDGWAACLGPVGMAWLFGKLIDGPSDAEAASAPLLTDAVLRLAWPAVRDFQALQRQKGGVVFGERWHGLKAMMEPVPQGSDVLAAWRHYFTEMRWPWLAIFDRTDVVYCPKGGPEALINFEQALRGNDADGSAQAAE